LGILALGDMIYRGKFKTSRVNVSISSIPAFRPVVRRYNI
jgi:hypothetical protein